MKRAVAADPALQGRVCQCGTVSEQGVIRALLALLAAFALGGGCDCGRRYVGMGDVEAVDAAALQATIRHDRIPGLMDPATTRFALASPELAATMAPGTRVRFVCRRGAAQLLMTRATVIGAGNPGLHDHTPHHGGVVAMAGMIHLEATVQPEGAIALYLSDRWRQPLSAAEVSGTVAVDSPGGARVLPLRAAGDRLEARAAPFDAASVSLRFALQREGEPVEVSFVLPLVPEGAGAAGIPVGGCQPAAADEAGLRCVLRFARPVVVLAATAEPAMLLVAMVDLGISAWRLPAGELWRGFAPPPAVPVPIGEAPHPEAPNAIAIGPTGKQAAVALENRIVVYEIATGRVERSFAGPGGILRTVSWSPDGRALLVASFYTPAAFLLDASDGNVLQTFAIEHEGSVLAISPDGRRVAVGSEQGPILLADLEGDGEPVLVPGSSPVRAVAFVGTRLAVVREDGGLALLDGATGAVAVEHRIDAGVRAAAFDPSCERLAAIGPDGRVVLSRLSDGASLARLGGHEAEVLSLAWAGPTLVTGDAAGVVALWEVAP